MKNDNSKTPKEKGEQPKYVKYDLGIRDALEKTLAIAQKEYPGEKIELVMDISPNLEFFVFYKVREEEDGPLETTH